MTEQNTAQTIDLTPTWVQAASMLAVVLENGTAEGRQAAREELARMGALLDKANALSAAAQPFIDRYVYLSTKVDLNNAQTFEEPVLSIGHYSQLATAVDAFRKENG